MMCTGRFLFFLLYSFEVTCFVAYNRTALEAGLKSPVNPGTKFNLVVSKGNPFSRADNSRPEYEPSGRSVGHIWLVV